MNQKLIVILGSTWGPRGPSFFISCFPEKTLSRLLDEAELETHRASADAAERANLNSETLIGASGFLSAIPSKVLRLAMPPAEFIEELRVRLWVPTYSQDHFCPCCDAISDRYGLHDRLPPRGSQSLLPVR